MPESSAHIVVVDDDARLRDLLARYLTEQGFRVSVVADAPAFDRARERESFDLAVLDLMLPGEDGLSIVRRLRANRDSLPVLMLTARGEDVDRIVGLEMGADDYLPKPFNPRELLARIRAILRRRETASTEQTREEVHFGPFVLSMDRRELTRDGVTMPITSGEFAVLKALADHPRRPLSRERLMELARGREHEAFDRAIDVQISRLRKLIETDPAKPRFIQTVWGHGYVFVPDARVGRGAA
jgi:two-component system phosphate regulon response regulator OmpR